MSMKTIRLSSRSSFDTLHVEAPGCIINIRQGLSTEDGRQVTHVEILADGDRFSGERQWWIEGKKRDHARNIRVIEAPKPTES